jgi:pyrimidine operon attenuation protein/uracil phosphoribosyltransferase
MLTTPFNPEIKSELSPIRIEQLNHLTVQAFKKDKTTIPDVQPNMNDLVIESCAIKDVLTELIQIGHSTAFYRIIDAAFSALIEEGRSEPVEIFNTYKTLMSLFRVAEREREVINSKINELDQVQADLDTLELEEFRRSRQRKSKKAKSKNSSRKKGGLSCV